MAITTAMRTEVSQLYVALFGRAPDGDGLGFWVQLRDQGQSLAQLANTMYATTPARTYFPSFLTNTEIISAFYVNVLGRTADADGLAFWTGKLNAAGATPGSVIAEMIGVVAGYTGTDAAGVISKDLFNNKVSVAQYYGEKNGTAAGATGALSGVTNVAATVTTAKTNIDNGTVGGVNQGQNFVLTTGVDNITGTNGNDTITADQTGANPQLTAADTVNGGSGTDTLKYFAKNTDTAIVLGSLSGVEQLYINGGGALVVSTAAQTTVTSVEVDAQTAALDLTVGAGQAVKLSNNNGTVFNDVLKFGTATSGAVTLNAVGKATAAATVDVQGTALATLNLTTSVGNSVVNLTNSAGTVLSTVNVAGDKNLTLTEALNGVKTINASTLTGNLTANVAGATLNAAFAFTGGTGADSLTVAAGALALITAGSQLDGGTGTDRLVTSETAALTAAQVAKVNASKGFEVLGFAASGSGVDVSSLTSINEFRVAAGNNTTSFTNANNTSKFTVDNSTSNTGTVTVANKVGDTTTSVTIDNTGATTAQTLNVLTLTGVTNVGLASAGAIGNIITTLNNADNSAITVTGAADLTFALKATTIGSKVDGSAATGKLAITGNTTAFSAGSSLGDILIGGTAADTLKASINNATLTGNAGNDTFDVSVALGGVTSITSITDLAKGDIVKFAATAGAFTATKVDLTAATTVTQALDLLAAGNNADLKWGQFGGNTYLVDDVGAGATFAATDTAVKITGLVDLATSTFAANAVTFA